jgi:hypothetical protein
LAEQVHPQCYQANIARSFAIAKEATFYAIGASKVTQFGGGDTCTAVIVGVQ